MSSGGKKARAKANRTKQEATAAAPTAHVPPQPQPQPRKRVTEAKAEYGVEAASEEEAARARRVDFFFTEAPARCVEGLQSFVEEMKMQATSNIATSGRQRDSKVERLFDVLSIDLSYLLLPKGPNRSETRKHHMRRLEAFRVLGNPEFQYIPQHIIGVLMLHATCDIVDSSDAKAGFMAAAWWISGAAKLGVAEAQFVYGELFRYGIFRDVHMRFARKYTRRASVQGHVRAIASMKELRSCLLCGVDDAPLMCACCRQARYCDAACSGKHWCEGGGVGGGAGEFAPSLEPHKTTCPRTHRTRRQDHKAAKKAAKAAEAAEEVCRGGC